MPWTPPTTYTDEVSTWGAADVTALGDALSDYTDEKSPSIDTSDASMDDAVAVELPGTKKRRIPIADKLVYDLREFYSGASQPADVIGYIHDGLAKTTVSGGWLTIPDQQEAWEVSEPIIPPFDSRMRGAGRTMFNERNGYAHGPSSTQFPDLPNHVGESWIRLTAGANCPVLMNDYANTEGKRGSARGNGAYNQWFTAHNIVFDHNGRNQTGSLIAVDIRSAWSMNFPNCRLVAPRGRGWSFSNCNECNGPGASAGGVNVHTSNGTGDLTVSTNTMLNASGTWVKGDAISTGTGVASGAYVTNVAGSTVTMSANATATGTGVAVTRSDWICTGLLVLEDSTVDSRWEDISMHGCMTAGVLLDSAYGCRVSGMTGYCIGGHNLQLSYTLGASPNNVGGCHGNKIDLRVEQATKHNVRIDNGCYDNIVDVVAFSPGLYNTDADVDGGWANVFCDGQDNVIRGTGYKATGVAPNISSMIRYGANAARNEDGGMRGGGDLPAGTPLIVYNSATAKQKNMPVAERALLAGGHLSPARTERIRLYDDFLGDLLDAQWNGVLGSNGAVVGPVITPAANGTIRMTTGTDTGTATMAVNGVQLDSGLNWRSADFATFETRVKINPGSTLVCVYVGFTDQVGTLEMPFTLAAGDILTSNASNAVGFLFDTSATNDNWWAVGVKADVDATKQNLAVAPTAGTFETLRVSLLNDGSCRFYRNDLLIGSLMSNAVTNTTLLTPVVAAFNRGAASSRTVDVDFVLCEQYRN